MARITAKHILDQLSDASWCTEAFEFYSCQNIGKNRILEKGSADFDKKVGLPGEKDWYRAAYYARKKYGYTDMHIRHNRSVFMKHKLARILKGKKALFIDFGCGPMTSGIMLAEMLSASNDDFNDQIIYVGIDSSVNMCKIAHWVNKIGDGSDIFDRFHILNTDSLDLGMLEEIIQNQFHPEITILCLSYVLAPSTFNHGYTAAVKLAEDWIEFNQQLSITKETYLIYMNPQFKSVHRNWNYVVQTYRDYTSKVWKYGVSERQTLKIDGLPGSVFTQMISGKRRH